jgi:ribosome biogenesis GTPase A
VVSSCSFCRGSRCSSALKFGIGNCSARRNHVCHTKNTHTIKMMSKSTKMVKMMTKSIKMVKRPFVASHILLIRPSKGTLHSAIHSTTCQVRSYSQQPVSPLQIQCPGCGAKYQTYNQNQPGYLPSLDKPKPLSVHQRSAQLLNLPVEDIDLKEATRIRLCQRCHRMQHQSVEYSRKFATDPSKQFSPILLAKSGIIVNVVDVFDLPGSLVHGIDKFVGTNKHIILAVNKCDLLPFDVHLDRVKHQVTNMARKTPGYGERLVHTVLMSGQQQSGIDGLIKAVKKYRKAGDDVIFVGNANVGKSQLVSTLLEYCAPPGGLDIPKPMSNSLPGTTASFIQIPLAVFGSTFRAKKTMVLTDLQNAAMIREKETTLIDTPGLFNGNSLLHLLTMSEIRNVIPNKPFDKATTYVLEPGESLFLGGLARMDYVTSEDHVVQSHQDRLRFTVFVSQNVKIHKTKTIKADNLYTKHVGTILTPPNSSIGWPEMKLVKTLTLSSDKIDSSCHDVVFDGLGWIAITGGFTNVKIDCWTAKKTPAVHHRRPSLLPFEFAKKLAVGQRPFVHKRIKLDKT